MRELGQVQRWHNGRGELKYLFFECFEGVHRGAQFRQFSRDDYIYWLGTRARRKSFGDMFDMLLCQLEHAGKDCDVIWRCSITCCAHSGVIFFPSDGRELEKALQKDINIRSNPFARSARASARGAGSLAFAPAPLAAPLALALLSYRTALLPYRTHI